MLRLKPFELHEPGTVAEAVALLEATPAAMLVSGGTDLIPKIKRRQFEPEVVISLQRVAGLDTIAEREGNLEIGALATLAMLERNRSVDSLHALGQAIRGVATPIIRGSATIGGNLLQDTRCRYYDRGHFWRDAVGFCLKKDGDECRVAPGGGKCFATLCSDVAPALIVLDAEVTLVGRETERTIPLENLYRDDGMDHLDIHGEILTRVTIPLKKKVSSYRKARTRDSFDFPEAGVAVAVDGGDDSIRVSAAVTGIACNIHVTRETITPGEVEAFADRVHAAVKPMDTLCYAPGYRKAVVRNLLAQQLDELISSR